MAWEALDMDFFTFSTQPPIILKNVPIRKRNPNKKVYNDWGFNTQPELFEHVWIKAQDKEGNVVCPISGEKLNKFMGTFLELNVFAHVLSKDKYTRFRLNPDNVVPVLPDVHTILDSGRLSDRAKHPDWNWDWWEEKKEQLKEQYDNYK